MGLFLVHHVNTKDCLFLQPVQWKSFIAQLAKELDLYMIYQWEPRQPTYPFTSCLFLLKQMFLVHHHAIKSSTSFMQAVSWKKVQPTFRRKTCKRFQTFFSQRQCILIRLMVGRVKSRLSLVDSTVVGNCFFSSLFFFWKKI